ncbi:hypothetical protein BLNAU_2158 [Blattamonas nauphoetae]|uniref:Uncharacterized protein n=1 Tax=Blattamonas nauphoetae TaxID=2049346 RepID=A0ABQ9YG30_9EUKA|nr:hypothetical protein BLNAU_2158 [Blattamonas nauphoetae]
MTTPNSRPNATEQTSVLDALHSAMKDSLPIQPDQQPKEAPKAPPSLGMTGFGDLNRAHRSQSLFVKSSHRTPYNYATDRPQPFDPRQAFEQARSLATDTSLPKSSLQLEETSTLLHPSDVQQITKLDESKLTPEQQGPRRRYTISSVQRGEKIPSQFKDVLLRSQDFAKRNKPKQPEPAPQISPSEQDAAALAAAAVAAERMRQNAGPIQVPFESLLLSSGAPEPHPSPPMKRTQMPKRQPSEESPKGTKTEPKPDEIETVVEPEKSPPPEILKDEEEPKGIEETGKDIQEEERPEDDEEKPDEQQDEEVFGLQYQDAILDFALHP